MNYQTRDTLNYDAQTPIKEDPLEEALDEPDYVSVNIEKAKLSQKKSSIKPQDISSLTDFDYKVNSKDGTRPTSKVVGRNDIVTTNNLDVLMGMQIDHPDNRFLRKTDYRSIDEEIRDLNMAREEAFFTLKNMIK
jgi:hypothetical protein